ncbi:MAG: Cysteine dioxygenase type I [bacterium P3]|nr:MAG: Cysteine dioxygenase type I [bacterium P3]KWW40146.1 MAG: Cysteine dioxygenase type I [bacterium F083]
MQKIQDDFALQSTIVPGYENFMQGLMPITQSGVIDTAMGERIKQYVLDYVRHTPLTGFNNYVDNGYSRNYIGRDRSGWEAIVMAWRSGNRTSIHSHPQFAGYTFADGEFLVEIFEPCEGGIQLVKRLEVCEQTGLYAIGEAGKFTNHIHRITCLSATAHSLHVYSDDALKGPKYDDMPVIQSSR